jgi:predicted metal-dependent hydrolase
MFAALKARLPRLVEDPLPQAISVAGRVVTLDVARNPRARRLTLRIGRDGSAARITAPAKVRNAEISAFLARHMGWLEQKLAAYPDRPLIRAGVKVPLGGVPHMIVRKAGRGVTRVEAGPSGPELHVFGPEGAVARRVADHLKKEARRVIEPMALVLAAEDRRKVASIRFKDTSSRWGSCTSGGALSFSWRIMMAPPKVVAYLVAHEVAHLTEMNHGPRFWALCDRLCGLRGADMAECRAWLKRNGAKLQSIAFEAGAPPQPAGDDAD